MDKSYREVNDKICLELIHKKIKVSENRDSKGGVAEDFYRTASLEEKLCKHNIS